MVNSGATMALVPDIAFLTSSLSSKRASGFFKGNVPSSIVILLRVLPILLIIAIIGVGPAVSTGNILLASVAGLFLGAGYLMYYYSMRREKLSKMTVISEIQPIVLVLFGTLVLGEIPSNLVIVGMLLIFVGAFIISADQGLKINKKLIPAAIGTTCWAIYWLIMAYTIQSSGNFAVLVLITQIISIVMLLVYLPFNKRLTRDLGSVFRDAFKGDRKTVLAIALIFIWAMGNGFGDSLYAYVIQLKLVSLGATANALVPVITLIGAYFIYKERLTKLQYFGVAVALIGAAMITIL